MLNVKFASTHLHSEHVAVYLHGMYFYVSSTCIY